MKKAYNRGTERDFNMAINGMKKVPKVKGDAWIDDKGTKIITLKKVKTDYVRPIYVWHESDVSDMTKCLTKDGYKIVSVNNVQYLLHRLVALAWVQNNDPKHKVEVDHIDMNRKNCAAENLEWVTKSENTRRAHAKNPQLTHAYLGRYNKSTQTFTSADGHQEHMTYARYLLTKRPDRIARDWKKLSYDEKIDGVFDIYYHHTDEDSDEAIFDLLKEVDFNDLYHECDKDLAKHYNFKCWLESIENYM